MRELIPSEFISLDGVIQAPGGIHSRPAFTSTAPHATRVVGRRRARLRS